MLRIIGLLLLSLLCHAGCAAAVALPPSRTDVSSMVVTRHGQLAHGTRLSTGVHWASGTRSRNVPFDIGAGVVYERSPGSETTKAATAPSAPVDHAWGGYIEAASRLSARGVTRSWIGGRAEVLRGRDRDGSTVSLTGRISWELYGGGVTAEAEGSGDAFAAVLAGGTAGLGSYLESGLRHTGDGEVELVVSAGLSVRLPAIFAFGMALK